MTATTMHEDPVRLSDEQFAKLVELLTPGYELAKIMLAQYQEKNDAPKEPSESQVETTED